MSRQSRSSREQIISIFISYRREDSAGHAGRLFDGIKNHFGRKVRIFMDIDAIAPGEDFPKTIEDAVGSCAALIAIIGKNWLTITDPTQHRRLDSEEDFVRLEIATALNRNIPVFPVLVQGATMPRQQDLPDALAGLTRRNALEISDTRWSYDLSRLIQTLEQVLHGKPRSWLKIGVIVFIAVVLVTIGIWKLIPITTHNTRNANVISSNIEQPPDSSPLKEIGIQTVRVQSQGGINRCGFFTPKGYLVTVTSGLERETEVTVTWRNGGKEWSERAQVVKRGELAPHATLLKLMGTSIVGQKAPIGSSLSLQPGDEVERYLATDDRKSGKVLKLRGQERFQFESGRTIVVNLLVTTVIAIGGQSGAPVLDTQGRIIAMVYGGNRSQTLSIPIEDIKNSFPDAF